MMKEILFLIVFIVLSSSIRTRSSRSALCFLTRKPASEVYWFAQQLANDSIPHDLDIFIMVDDENVSLTEFQESDNFRVLKGDRQRCIEYGYQKSIFYGGETQPLTSWDKAFYYFNVLDKNHSFVWFVEDDVFIPSTRAFLSIHELYSNNSDLIISTNLKNFIGATEDWWWHLEFGYFVPPWSSSMANVIGMSRRLLISIDEYVRWRGFLPFHEFSINTLSMHLNLTITTPIEMAHLSYRNYYEYSDIENSPNDLWHPIKDLALHQLWRENLTNLYDNLNFTLDFRLIKTLCKQIQTTETIEEFLTNLLSDYEIFKTRFNAKQRISHRKQFADVFEQCQYSIVTTEEIIKLLKSLMDHAFKLPEAPLINVVLKKSDEHKRLEKLLEINKKIILNEYKKKARNSARINKLREQAFDLTSQLTMEIQREIDEVKIQLSNTSFVAIEETSLMMDYSSEVTADLTRNSTESNQLEDESIERNRSNQMFTSKLSLNNYVSRENSEEFFILLVLVLFLCLLFISRLRH